MMLTMLLYTCNIAAHHGDILYLTLPGRACLLARDLFPSTIRFGVVRNKGSIRTAGETFHNILSNCFTRRYVQSSFGRTEEIILQSILAFLVLSWYLRLLFAYFFFQSFVIKFGQFSLQIIRYRV